MASGRRRQEIPFAMTADNRTQAAFRQLRNDVRSLNRLGQTSLGIFGGAFGVAAFRDFGRAIGGLIQEVTELEEKAREFSATTQEIANLRFTGQLFGLADEQINQLLTRVIEFRRAVQQAAPEGFDANRAAAERLNLSLEELNRLNAPEILGRIVGELNNISDAQERIDLAQQLGGGEQAAIFLRLAQQGTAAFQQAQAEAEIFFDTTGDATEAVRVLSQGLTRIQRATIGNIVREFAELSDEAADAERAFVRLATFISAVRIPDLVDIAISPLGAFIGVLDRAVDFSNEQVDQLQNQRSLNEEIAQTNRLLADLRGGQNFSLARQADDEANRAARAAADARRERLQLVRDSNALVSDIQRIAQTRELDRQTGQAVTGTRAEFEAALVRGQQTDPQLQELQSILNVLERQQTDQLLQSILERINAGALDNPVFS